MAAAGTVAIAGAVSVTLMACYGGPGVDDGTQYCPTMHAYIAADASCDAVDSGFDKPDVSVGDAAATIDSGPDAGGMGDAATDASRDASDGDGG